MLHCFYQFLKKKNPPFSKVHAVTARSAMCCFHTCADPENVSGGPNLKSYFQNHEIPNP